MMRKVFVLASVLALAGSLSYGQVTQVVSRNAVGYVRVDVPANGLNLAAIPFFEVGDDGKHTVGEVMGGQLNGGFTFGSADNVLKWDKSNQAYIIFWKSTFTGQWRQFPEGSETTNTLNPGEGFWISNIQSTSQVVYMMGEVPDANTIPSGDADVEGVAGLTMLSYAFPTEIALTSTTLEATATKGFTFGSADNLLAWDVTNQAYVIYWISQFGGSWRKFPEGSSTTETLKPGQGLFYSRFSGGPFTWTESKPYTWP